MSLFPPINLKKWENYKLILLKEVFLSEVEKNAGLSLLQDLLEFMPPNSKLVMINSKVNFGEITILMLKVKNGELKIPTTMVHLLKELSVNSSWNQSLH